MKKLVLMLMAVTMMLPMANAQELTKQQAKAVKKEVKKKMKEKYNKFGNLEYELKNGFGKVKEYDYDS